MNQGEGEKGKNATHQRQCGGATLEEWESGGGGDKVDEVPKRRKSNSRGLSKIGIEKILDAGKRTRGNPKTALPTNA